MMLMIIHLNSPVDQPAFMLDRDGNAIEIDHTGAFKCSIKKQRSDTIPILTFVTGGGSGVGNITVISDTIEDELRDLFLFTAEQPLIAGIEPGAYYADLLRTDDPGWEIKFDVIVEEGVTAP